MASRTECYVDTSALIAALDLRAIQFLAFIRELRPLAIVSFGSEDIGKASALLNKFADQKVTLADLHGLVIMRERRIKACWSTDRHLGLTGVRRIE